MVIHNHTRSIQEKLFKNMQLLLLYKINVTSKFTLLYQSHSSKETHKNHWIIQFTKVIFLSQNFYYNNFSNISSTNFIIATSHPLISLTLNNYKSQIKFFFSYNNLNFLHTKRKSSPLQTSFINYNFVSLGRFCKLYQHSHTKIKLYFILQQ